MPRATDEWLMNWEGPSRYEFIENCVENLSGDQKWYALVFRKIFK